MLSYNDLLTRYYTTITLTLSPQKIFLRVKWNTHFGLYKERGDSGQNVRIRGVKNLHLLPIGLESNCSTFIASWWYGKATTAETIHSFKTTCIGPEKDVERTTRNITVSLWPKLSKCFHKVTQRSLKIGWSMFDVFRTLVRDFETLSSTYGEVLTFLGTVMKSIGKGYKKGGCEHNPPFKSFRKGISPQIKTFSLHFQGSISTLYGIPIS